MNRHSAQNPKKHRWRTTKKYLHTNKTTQTQKSFSMNPRRIAQEVFLIRRLKAFLTDIFMIYMPILYLVTYLILGGAQAFRDNQLAIFLCFVVYALICSIFIAISGSTPGLKYVGLKLVRASSLHKLSMTFPKDLAEFNKLDHTIQYNRHTESIQYERVGFFRAFVRVFLWAFWCALLIGMISPFFVKSHRFLHDIMSGTMLVESK